MTDIIVVGGGLTGLTMACALGHHNFAVTLIAPDIKKKQAADQRSTAIMMSGIKFLDDLGIWKSCTSHAASLDIMRIVNGSQVVDFEPHDMNQDHFAFNIPNNILIKTLRKKAIAAKNITIIDQKLSDLKIDSAKTTVSLENKKSITASLVIAADGRQSKTRELCDIQTKIHDFHQKALVCTFEHSEPHNNISTEIHRAGGPFTLVPLPDKNSALVWCDKENVIDEVMSTNKKEQTALIQKVSNDRLGTIKLTSKPQSWPIIAMKAKSVIAPRVALVGESAHSIAPIAAQGFNLSLRDIQSLLSHLTQARDLGLDLGSKIVLKNYAIDRVPDIAMRYHGVGILNTLIAHSSLPASLIKRAGLSTMKWDNPIKDFAIRVGMGA